MRIERAAAAIVVLATIACGHAGGRPPPMLLASRPPAPAAGPTPQRPERVVVLRAARLIDGSGAPPLTGAAVLVRGARIEAVGSDLDVPQDAEVIDLGRSTLLPGLIDLHTHLTMQEGVHWEDELVRTTPAQAAIWGVRNARETLRAGFTTCRDMGPVWSFVDVDLRKMIDGGVVPGPRLQVSGNYVSSTGGAGDARQFSPFVEVHGASNLADGVDEVRKATRTNFKHGADFIKIMATGAVLSKGASPGAQQYSEEELRAAVVEANRWGTYVAAHAHGAEGIRAALRAGVRTVDHGSMMDDDALAVLKEGNAYYVPTLYVSVHVNREAQGHTIPASEVERSKKMFAARRATFRKALAAGLDIPFSTDAGIFPHGLNAREFEVRVSEGESPMHAIVSATKVAAEAMGWGDRVGTIESGKYADIIAVAGDPLTDVTELERVRFVMKDGQVFRHEGPPAATPRRAVP
jgi:imidazolonepropionase-like amidohydrolase